MVQRRTQRVQIRAWISVALILFRWRVAWRAQRRGLLAPRIAGSVSARNAKIDEVCPLIVGPNNDVGGFDVSMHYWRILACQVVQYVQNLSSADQCFAL